MSTKNSEPRVRLIMQALTSREASPEVVTAVLSESRSPKARRSVRTQKNLEIALMRQAEFLLAIPEKLKSRKAPSGDIRNIIAEACGKMGATEDRPLLTDEQRLEAEMADIALHNELQPGYRFPHAGVPASQPEAEGGDEEDPR